FQDWARREAARARPLDVPPGDADDEDDLPPLVNDRPPRRTTPGTWAAPPPWLRGSSPSAGAAGSGTGAPGAAPSRAADPGGHGSAAGPESAAAGIAGAAAGAGLSGSFADRLLGTPGGGVPPASPAPPTPEWRRGDAWDDEVTDAAEEPEPEDLFEDSRPAAPAGLPPGPRRPARERLDAGRPSEDERERDVWAPAWERPRRLEAYPTLRSRRFSGIGLSPLLLALLAVLLAGAALFFLPSLFIGSPGGASPTPGVAASASPLASLEPTLEPAPTPFLYTVQSGDTMSRIATKFGIPLGTLIAANKTTVPNPDVLNVGDQVIIPVALPSEIPGASTAP
ncbi:MAG TPA: LysM peptidoglycan-binding domain-containing protein, partial [Candidatus Acidoferrales bacterium]|nr:LysM peptidoglycan-binding domain-containing protein [Candidatus Acidoferrales bacterium]